MSETFVGVIVVAIIGNAAEHSTAVLVVLKDEELEHFAMLRDAYQPPAKENIVDEVDNLAGYIDRLYALRDNDAVHQLAMMNAYLASGY
jgi:hypothetical protein